MATSTTRDPAATVRRAWSTLRLPALQAIVNSTIRELEQLSPRDLLGRELSPLESQSDNNPIAAALEAFSEELRDESGMADSRARRIEQSAHIRENMLDQPQAWTTAFHEALDKYRQAAAQVLSVSLSDPTS
jgi:hypothetical protein